jgi:N-acyl-phosphatidylethanolamine-hydrolysing phospholipase D
MGNFRTRSGAARPSAAPLRRLEELLAGSGDFAYWIGHATVLVRMAGKIFLTDPIWSGAAGPYGRFGAARLAELPFGLESLPPIDFVLISHNHYDHLDVPTLTALAEKNRDLVLIAPLGNSAVLEDLGASGVETLDWGDTTRRADLEITCLPVQHWSRRGLFDARRGLWSSWAVNSAEKRFFFGGDTGLFPELAAIGATLGPFDLAALPIGAYEPSAMMKAFHLNPEETAEAAAMLRSEHVLAVHYGTFDLTDEPLDEPPRRFRAAMARAGRSEESVWTLPIGDGRTF